MKNAEISDPLFRQAVEAIDEGNITELAGLIAEHPKLLSERLITTENGYFKDPYLLYFVADNPIRIDKLPSNIVDITHLLVSELKNIAADSMQQQLDYTLGLVATGRIPRECGVQIAMIDLLIDAGAKPGGGLGALAHGNIAAAERLLERGGKLTLPVAVGLERMDDVKRMTENTSADEKLVALAAAAFYGKHHIISFLLAAGTDPNHQPKDMMGFHGHATPLHQAVYSGSLDAVKLLVEAGARLDVPDKAYGGTPLGWAGYMQTEEGYDEETKSNFAIIEAYLLGIKNK